MDLSGTGLPGETPVVSDRIPVIDLFAGPGGLGEGVSAFELPDGRHPFRIGLSIEMDPDAHRTLELRAFFRQFEKGEDRSAYYRYLRGEITRDELFADPRFREKVAAAKKETAGGPRILGQADPGEIDRLIREALGTADRPWVLIGGPPCQAYSLVGRARRRNTDPDFEKDPKHFLYREYLRIIRAHRPPVFVMENVKGILSATVGGQPIFDRILNDLRHPDPDDDGLRYEIHSFVSGGGSLRPQDYIIKSERYGIPQMRHRVILFGVRSDLKRCDRILKPRRGPGVRDILDGLPKLRSHLSRGDDNDDAWLKAVATFAHEPGDAPVADRIHDSIADQSAMLRAIAGEKRKVVGRFMNAAPSFSGAWFTEHQEYVVWYRDAELKGVCNHATRGHIIPDLHRYLFAACYGEVHGRSPKLAEFPASLLPEHSNVGDAVEGSMFSDRFRVQLAGGPSSTITSHISKDGHYFIHYDPVQCRSLTVREAARLQTFPDNYFFEGERTAQYHQVGNAVPPMLAMQLAAIVHETLFPKAAVAGHTDLLAEEPQQSLF